MEISVTDAKGQLTELVRRAEAGDEIILTRHGKAAVRFVAMKTISQKRILHAQVKAGMLRMAFCIGVWVFVRTSFAKLAERGRFELPIGLPLCRISSAVHSTTLPPLRRMGRKTHGRAAR